MSNTCNRWVESADFHRTKCTANPVAEIAFIGARGKTTELICKRHLNGVVKRTETLRRNYGFDAELEINYLNEQE